jgi:hypothetical protein
MGVERFLEVFSNDLAFSLGERIMQRSQDLPFWMKDDDYARALLVAALPLQRAIEEQLNDGTVPLPKVKRYSWMLATAIAHGVGKQFVSPWSDIAEALMVRDLAETIAAGTRAVDSTALFGQTRQLKDIFDSLVILPEEATQKMLMLVEGSMMARLSRVQVAGYMPLYHSHRLMSAPAYREVINKVLALSARHQDDATAA